MRLFRSNEFAQWFDAQPKKIRAQINARLLKIELENHFGSRKHLKGYLWELKFNNGNRIYYTIKILDEEILFLILGGNKNGQQKDIDKAFKIAQEIHRK